MIKKLWYGGSTDDDFVDFNGEYFLLRRARLYTPPSGHIPLYMAASGPKAAMAAAKYSDGLITYLTPSEAGRILEIFDRTAKTEREPGFIPEKIAEYKVSFSDDYDRAFQTASFWRSTLIKDVFDSELSDPRKLQQKAESDVSDEELKKAIQITTSIEDCIKPLEEYFRTGFTRVYVHSTSPDEIKFVQAFCKKVMPHFAQAGTAMA